MGRVFAWINESPLKTAFHRVLFQNAALVRLVGLKLPPRTGVKGGYGDYYGDLTTVLLARKLRKLIPSRSLQRVHEIGVGMHGVLSIYVSKRCPGVVVSGSTIDPAEVAGTRKSAAMNGCSFECVQSDVLDQVSGRFDLFWWNLPYYAPEVEDLIDRLFRTVNDKGLLAPGGLVLLGFNTLPLGIERVTAIVGRHPYFRVQEIQTYSWNPHALVLAEYQPRPDAAVDQSSG